MRWSAVRTTIFTLSVGLFFLSGICSAAGVEIHFIDIGQGDAILVKSEEANFLIDTGSLANGYRLYHYLSKENVKEFLDRVSPSIAVISVAEPNRFGYPCRETLQRLKESVDRIHRTDRDGTVVVETDGVNVKIRRKPQ
jgi:beta-lactamase superfamily II metal-dependent hydrolase